MNSINISLYKCCTPDSKEMDFWKNIHIYHATLWLQSGVLYSLSWKIKQNHILALVLFNCEPLNFKSCTPDIGTRVFFNDHWGLNHIWIGQIKVFFMKEHIVLIVTTTFADFVWVIDSKFNFLFEITYFCVALLT